MSKLSRILARYFKVSSIGANLYLIAPCNLAVLANVNRVKECFVAQCIKDTMTDGSREIDDPANPVRKRNLKFITWEWDNLCRTFHENNFGLFKVEVKGKSV